MAFIETISARNACGETREMYAHQQKHYGFVPHYATVFSHRPHVMKLWSDLQYGIRREMDKRRFELVTVAAAMSVRSTYCSLAHANALLKFYSSDEVLAIVNDTEASPLMPAETAMYRFASKIAGNASAITEEEVLGLRQHGFTDAEIFDIAATATARSFFAQLCEGLGAVGDHLYEHMDQRLRKTLVVGRPLECTNPERLTDEVPARSSDPEAADVASGNGVNHDQRQHSAAMSWLAYSG